MSGHCDDPRCTLPPPTRRMRAVAWVTTRDWLPLWLRKRILLSAMNGWLFR